MLISRKNIILTHEGERMSTEIPIWMNGKFRWLSGIDRKTTCKDVVEVLLEGEGIGKSEVKNFAIMERWRKVERPLDDNSKILKIWSHWGNEKKDVRLCLRRIENEVDSGRGSPVGNGHTPSLRRKRNRTRGNGKPPWIHSETLHPRRLAELENFNKKEYDEYHHIKNKPGEISDNFEGLNDIHVYDNKVCKYEDTYEAVNDIENVNVKRKSVHKSYHCSGTGRLHSTPLQNPENHSRRKCCKRESKQKIRNSENIEKLMKLILAQGATIQNQLQKLKEREEQIESLEQERHRERIEKNGRNYLLETYLGSLKDAEIPDDVDDKKGNDSGINTEGGSDQNNPLKVESIERLKLMETEIPSDVDIKNFDRVHSRVGHRSEDSNTHSLKLNQKNLRSKSESRCNESKLDGSLKRTLSENALSETTDIGLENIYPENLGDPETLYNAKDHSEEVAQLQKIQSQIEIWEKVFKINKKLEKEEENLVRLHIKIKKYQSENYRFATEKYCENSEDAEKKAKVKTDQEPYTKLEDTEFKKGCTEIQKSLETLKMDLEQNSKEIYENFTRLIEDDEIVEQKRSCLTQLITDLERIDQEHDMLKEMLEQKESNSSFNTESPQIDFPVVENSLSVSGKNTSVTEMTPQRKNEILHPSDLGLPQINQDYFNQRTDASILQEAPQPTKPKIVKISFEDQTQNSTQTKTLQEKSPPSVPAGALKSILKNKKYNEKTNQISQSCIEASQGYTLIENNYQKNDIPVNNNYVESKYNYTQERLPTSYPYSIPYPVYDHQYQEHNPNLYGQTNASKFSEELKTGYITRGSQIHSVTPKTTNAFPHSTIVTTKALVHTDTDSSTSSDTSGLSSMYSSSPTVEESYVEQNYVLDTLV